MTEALVLRRSPQPATFLVAGGMLLAPITGTSSTLGSPSDTRYSGLSMTQAGYAVAPLPTGSVADEVSALQEQIRSRASLTRQQIARALGVDRRSLSAWASGSTRPGLRRLDALRFLAQLVRDLDARHPGRVHELLLAVHSGNRDALSMIAEGRFDVAWRLAKTAKGRPVISITRITRTKPPVYAAAARALREGRLDRPVPSRTVRNQDVYEMDLAEALLFEEEPQEEP